MGRGRLGDVIECIFEIVDLRVAQSFYAWFSFSFFFFWWSAIYDLSRIGPQRGMLSSPYGHANRLLTRLNPAGRSGYREFKPRALSTNQGGNALTHTSRASGAAVLWK